MYHRAVCEYLRRCVRDADGADELAQEFWLKFLRGAFDNAAPEKGSFRKYLRTALSHLATRARAVRPAAPLPADAPAAADD